MTCQETRERLSAYHDKELNGDERKAVADHLTECPDCRDDLEANGALDMLLKDCYSMEPPTERMDAFWPSLAERMEESPAAEPVAGGGGPVGREEEIVFESSAAMQVLNIPEPPPEPVAVSPEAAESAGAVAPAPAASPWRWPVALIFSTAIVVVGILAYKKMTPPQQPTYMASAAGGQERGQPHPGDPGQPGQPGHPGQPGQPAAPAPSLLPGRPPRPQVPRNPMPRCSPARSRRSVFRSRVTRPA